MEICIHLNGEKCAESYCAYWSTTFKKCSLAVESEKRAELLDIMVSKLGKDTKLVQTTTTMAEESKTALH